MKRLFIAAVVLLWSAAPLAAQKTLPDGVQDLAAQIVAGLEKQKKQRVGITAFTELQGTQTVFGAYLAEAITTRLVKAGIDVVERPLMDKVMVALNVEASGAIDPATAKRVGTQAGVEAIVIGTTTDLSSAIEVNARVIDAASGRVVAAAQSLLTKDTMVSSMLARPLGAPSVAPTPSKEPPKKKPPTKSDTESEDSNSWMASGTRIVVDEGRRNGSSIVLALAFENEADDLRTVKPRTYHLIDENGDRYKYSNDSEDFVENGVTIPPGTRARSTFWFHCNTGGCNGTKFMVLDPNNTIVLRNLLVARR